MLKRLVKIANKLDSVGRINEADFLDWVMEKMAVGPHDDDDDWWEAVEPSDEELGLIEEEGIQDDPDMSEIPLHKQMLELVNALENDRIPLEQKEMIAEMLDVVLMDMHKGWGAGDFLGRSPDELSMLPAAEASKKR